MSSNKSQIANRYLKIFQKIEKSITFENLDSQKIINPVNSVRLDLNPGIPDIVTKPESMTKKNVKVFDQKNNSTS